ncbi:MAG: MBL fold metallo-hydrolase [Kangiellaceae bacterium]|nr:MBL fold metallo-hydrolase [Kangiellaceae bacterium]
MNSIDIKAFFDSTTYTVTYVVSDRTSGHCAIIDSVLDFDVASGSTATQSADEVIHYVEDNQLAVDWILESHAHADHLSAAPYLKKRLGGQTAIGARITQVQSTFAEVFGFESEFVADGNQFDRLLSEGDKLTIGSTELLVMHTPGHTPACLSFLIEDCIFVGDTLFMPDFGTARTDFPGGNAETLYNSIQRILCLPPKTRVFTGHDYMAEGRKFYAWESTIEEQKQSNIHINHRISKKQFVEYRTTRDADLSLPKLIIPAVQINIRAGEMPPKELNGISYLKLPLNTL